MSDFYNRLNVASAFYYDTVLLMNRSSIWDYLPQPERDCIPPEDREDRQVYTGYWIYYNRDGSVPSDRNSRIFRNSAG